MNSVLETKTLLYVATLSWVTFLVEWLLQSRHHVVWHAREFVAATSIVLLLGDSSSTLIKAVSIALYHKWFGHCFCMFG